MNRKMVEKAYREIDHFTEKFGENFFNAIMEEDNTSYEMAKNIIAVLDTCETDRDFEIADKMLIACCGYSFSTIIEGIQKLDQLGHKWESC